ncbi:hypothetical protein [Flavobacterium sp. GNP001]
MQKIDRKIKIIGLYQAIGGLIGLIGSLFLIVKFSSSNESTTKILLLFFALYSFSMYCGYLLLKNQIKKGLNYSILNQSIQVLSFQILGFTYKFYSGVFLCFGLNVTNDTILTFNFGITSSDFKLNSDSEVAELSINLIAIILISVLFSLKENVSRDTIEK